MEQPIVPVYLNQKLVFDLVAMLRGGISTVTSITSNTTSQENQQRDVSAGFGLSEALSTLLSINLSAGQSKGQSSGSDSTSAEERVHTPASLFYELKSMLTEQGFVKPASIEQFPRSGEFVDFSASLKRNTIIETLDSLSEMLKLAVAFSEEPQNKKGSGKKQKSEEEKLQEQIVYLSDSMKAGSTTDLTASVSESSLHGVVTVETKFLNDPLMSDLVDGKFNVLGKVIRSVQTEDDSINLLRKTALEKMPKETLDALLNAFSELNSEEGFSVPEMLWEVPGPAIQVLPVAIYA